MRTLFFVVMAGVAAGSAPGASVRLEDWARLRTAAAPILGWKVGLAPGAFRQLTFVEAAGKADALGVSIVPGLSTQKLSPDIPKNVDPKLAAGEVTAVKDSLRSLNLRMPAYFTAAIGPDENAARRLFEFARSLGVETVVSSPERSLLPVIDRLANEFGINVALGNPAYSDPGTAMAALEGRSKRLGLCADIGSWLEKGIQPIDGLSLVKDRLLGVILRDRSALGGGGNVPLGSGVAGLPAFLRQMYRMELKPSFLLVDTTGAEDPFADLARSLEGFEKALQPVMAGHVNRISRTEAIRGPDRLSPEERRNIEAALPQRAPVKPKKPRKLLVMDLNVSYPGHRSIPHVNLALELMGKNTGAYEAVFSNDLDNLKPAGIRRFDAVFLNNTVGMIFVDPEVREGLAQFVREGGGLAGIHGVSHASMDWPEFSEMIGAWRGVHREPTERATIRIDDPDSPLTAAFGGKEFVYQDEFFRFPTRHYSRDRLHVLLSVDVEKTDMNQGRPCFQPCSRPDNDYGVSWIRSYGKGRVFFCTLGHNPALFMTRPLPEYFLAGIQFILGDLEADTTPSARLKRTPTAGGIEPLLAKLATYDYGDDPAPATELDELVSASQATPAVGQAVEARLLEFLQSNATLAGKNAVLREIRLIGSSASVPVLAPMLAREESAEMARYALAAIPGPAADQALRAGLGRAPNDRVRIGIVSSLGERRDEKAVPALAALLSSSNPEIGSAAAAALANIADRPALSALAAAASNAGRAVRELMAEAYVTCADQLAARGDTAAAVNVYRKMMAPGEPARIRTRALAGLAAAERRKAVPVLAAEIQSGDSERQAVAIGLLNGIAGPDITRMLVAWFPKLPASGQVHLLTALAHRGDVSARPVITAALASSTPEVRAAALTALGRLGDASSVRTLAEAAAAGKEPEQSAARRSLSMLRGADIDRAIITGIASGAGGVKAELILAAGERGAAGAADALTRAALDSGPEVRRAALRALRTVGGPTQIPALLDLLLKASTAPERRDATQTLATVLKRAQPAPVNAIISAYHAAPARPSRLSLIEVLGQTSNDEALPLLRAGVRDPDPEIARAAILALSDWDNPAPLADLLDFVKSGPPPPAANLQVLAVRGVLKLMVLDSRRPASENGRLLAEIMALASQTPEKLTVLSLLPYFPCKESLEAAQAALRDPAIAGEAKVALAQVNEALKAK
jgi:HEAT repeat protein/type 1 glutamine amidotransferase/sugar phosphate isomerase/epimerase